MIEDGSGMKIGFRSALSSPHIYCAVYYHNDTADEGSLRTYVLHTQSDYNFVGSLLESALRTYSPSESQERSELILIHSFQEHRL